MILSTKVNVKNRKTGNGAVFETLLPAFDIFLVAEKPQKIKSVWIFCIKRYRGVTYF